MHRYQNVEFMVEQSYYDEEILPLSDSGELVPGLGLEGGIDFESLEAEE